MKITEAIVLANIWDIWEPSVCYSPRTSTYSVEAIYHLLSMLLPLLLQVFN